MAEVEMREVKAIVRTDCVADLLRALQRADVTRFYVSRVHAVGTGADPEDSRISLDEGEVYTEKTKIEFLCRADRSQDLVGIVREWARTGHRGDGVVIVSSVTDVVNVRTGDHDRIALL
jgi:nitrogen regulatory protein PII